MRLLLDENLDWRLGREIVNHQTDSVPRLGWAGTKNGELLRRAEANGYDAFITMDSGIYHQQNVAALSLAVIALRAKSNRLAETRPLIPHLLALLPTIEPGRFYSLSC